jgi:hypothetical protein
VVSGVNLYSRIYRDFGRDAAGKEALEKPQAGRGDHPPSKAMFDASFA